MKRIAYALLTALPVLLQGCGKDDGVHPADGGLRGIQINLQFAVDNVPLQFDAINYVNAAGNSYGVSRLQFYLSGFRFEQATGPVIAMDGIFYVDARNATPAGIRFETLPPGTYTGLSFCIGLDSLHNTTGCLPHTVENENMAWPGLMGGGYHFLKLEGNFMDQGNPYGFAMHVGRNENRVAVALMKRFSISKYANAITLEMNVNEWFVNPYVYDFNVDNNYTMGDSVAMGKLAANGVDVFTMK